MCRQEKRTAMSPPTSNAASIGRDAAIALAAAGLTTVLLAADLLAPLDRSVGDALLRLTHRHPAVVPVAAVTIDNRSVAEIGPLPWPRSRLTAVVAAAHAAGARAVLLDLLLTEAGDTADDYSLAGAISAGPTVLAAAIAPDGGWLLPDPVFGGADFAAHVQFEVGPDGVARTLVATKQAEGLSLPAMSLAAARLVRPELAVEPGRILRPDFRPGPDQIPQLAATDLLATGDSARKLVGNLVFIGITATGSGDRLIVPTGPRSGLAPGVLVHASVTSSLLRGGMVTQPSTAWLLFGTFLAALATQLIRTRSGALNLVSLGVGVAVTAVGVIIVAELWWVLLPLSAYFAAALLAVVIREGLESRTARLESGRLLHSLLTHHNARRMGLIPTTASDRLAALEELQAAVLRDDAARRTLLESLHDGVVMWTAADRIVVTNPAADRLWGGPPHRDDFPSGNDTDPTAASIHPRYGREISVTVTPIGDGGMAVLRDVTAERELERKRREMQRLVSHELKTPLASIAGFGETLERYELERDEQRRVATLIRGESEKLGEMVSTFLDLERIASGQWELPDEAIEIASVVEDRLDVLGDTIRRRNIVIERRMEQGVRVLIAESLLGRVIDNLVGNAIKFSPEGGTVEIGVDREEGDARLRVTDHGPGIPEEAMAHLFERFYRVPGTTERGSGLGLAVAHEVTTWHGGCITVDSIAGRGSTFTARFPAEE